ncbi:hypothetical protein CQR48_0420 [Bifidobacterium thermophilum]|uniref:hypothetical protein n=1 Tax=Bifidobacterium thermophilum TaxID=33905 RepID=UPI000C6FDFBC|nr:hypothetical protein [Bifidobacterium thermophilum]PKU90638.1 hypothetical protein CQR48_0420 [Bifidobacterium thermophilum]
MHTLAARGMTLAASSDIKTNMKLGYDQFIEKSGIEGGTIGTLLKVIGGLIIIICVGVLILRKWNPQTQMFQGIQQGIGAMGVFVVICGLVVGLLLIAPQTIGDFLVQIAGVFVQFFMDILSKVFGVTMG